MKSFSFSLIIIIILGAFSCTRNPTCKELSQYYFDFSINKNNHADTIVFENYLDKIINTTVSCEYAYQLRGFLYLTKNDTDKAKYAFLKAFTINDSSVYTLYCLASLYNLKGHNDTAFQYINKALACKLKRGYYIDHNNLFGPPLDIPYDELIFFRGMIYFESKNLDLAKKDFLAALKAGHEKPELYEYLSDVYLKIGMKDSANYYLQN